jgi:hypothetical protein
MKSITSDITDLLTVTSTITTDVAIILTDLTTANNITSAQKQTLEAQIAILQRIDASIRVVIKSFASPVLPVVPMFVGIARVATINIQVGA